MTGNPESRVKGGRVRGAVMMEWAVARGLTVTPEQAADLLARAVARVDKAHHDAQPRIQWHTFETNYGRPPNAMRDLYKVVASAFGLLWFSEGQPVVWYHYGGSSRLRVEVAMWCARSLWNWCERHAAKELQKQGYTTETRHAANVYKNQQRHAWLDELEEQTTQREIEEWVQEAWKVECHRQRARRKDPTGFVPRTMSYEQVSRWLDEVIEASS